MCKRKSSSSSRAASRPPKRQKQQQSTKSHISKAITIPDYLKNVIADKGKGLFELTFTIASQNGLQRLAWGLDLRAEFVKVFLKFSDGKQSNFASFCVHASTDNEERELRHSFHTSKGNDPIMSPCSPRSTILSCVLTREVYGLTGLRQCRDLSIIYKTVWETIKSDPTKHCLICGKDFQSGFPVKLYTPTACAGRCMKTLDKWPLRARLSHLLSDVKTLDFLLCSIYTAVIGQKLFPYLYRTDDSLLVGCPLELEQIQPAIDSFPELSDKLTINDLLDARSGRLRNARRKLLSWLSLRARGCLVSLKPDTEHFIGGKSMEMCHQFMLLNSVLERQREFAKNIQKVGVRSVAFHGCRAPRTFNILTDALRDMKGKGYGGSVGGVYFSSKPSYSFSWYAANPTRPFRAWKSSIYGGKSWAVVFGLEVAMSHIPFTSGSYPEYYTRDEGQVMIRYVFLIPMSDDSGMALRPPTDLNTAIKQDAMKEAFKDLDEGRLNQRQIGLDVDESGWKHG